MLTILRSFGDQHDLESQPMTPVSLLAYLPRHTGISLIAFRMGRLLSEVICTKEVNEDRETTLRAWHILGQMERKNKITRK